MSVLRFSWGGVEAKRAFGYYYVNLGLMGRSCELLGERAVSGETWGCDGLVVGVSR